MATVIPNIEKPVTIHSKAYELAKKIALDGNYSDILNAMALICRYARVYSTGKVTPIRKLRGGIEDSTVAALESVFTGRTLQPNAVQDFNHLRDNFFRIVAQVNPGVYNYIATTSGTDLLDRVCVERIVIAGEVDILDCEGTLLGKATDVESFLDLWNNQKVPADLAICGEFTPYYFDTYVNGYLGISVLNPDNNTIIYNAPSPSQFRQREDFKKDREFITDEENRIQPKSISTYSNRDL